ASDVCSDLGDQLRERRVVYREGRAVPRHDRNRSVPFMVDVGEHAVRLDLREHALAPRELVELGVLRQTTTHVRDIGDQTWPDFVDGADGEARLDVALDEHRQKLALPLVFERSCQFGDPLLCVVASDLAPVKCGDDFPHYVDRELNSGSGKLDSRWNLLHEEVDARLV